MAEVSQVRVRGTLYDIKDTVARRGSGSSPAVASTAAGMTDTSKIYVYTGSETGYTAGNWYYYDGTSWVSGGIYQSSGIETDTTLAVSGAAADSKATGDAINNIVYVGSEVQDSHTQMLVSPTTSELEIVTKTEFDTELNDLKSHLNEKASVSASGDYVFLDTESGGAAQRLAVPSQSAFLDLKAQVESGGDGLTTAIKSALLQLADFVAYINANGQTYRNALYDAFYPPVEYTAIALDKNSLSFGSLNTTQQLTAVTTPSGGNVTWSSSNTSVATVSQTGLVTSVGYGNATITATCGSVSATCSVAIAQATVTSISANYTQSGTVYDTDSLDSLKSDLVVTATWSNQSTSTVASADYTLSGTLTSGTSTITVTYSGKTATFNVTVTADTFPSEYQKVEWIGVDSTDAVYAYFDVGISLSAKSELEGYEVDYTAMSNLPKAPAKNTCVQLISWSGNAGCYFGSVCDTVRSAVYGWGSVDTEGTTFDSSEVATGEAHTFHTYWDSSSGITECGSYSCSRAYVQGAADLNLRLGAGTFANNNGNYKFYGDIKIKKDGTLVRDLYPCYRKADSVIGFYDKVTDTFYTKTGNATIVKGVDI